MTLSGFCDETTNYDGEAKIGYLTLCSGVGGAFHHQNNNNFASPPKSTATTPPPKACPRLAQLKNVNRAINVPRSEVAHHNLPRPGAGLSSLPRLVKVAVYTKAASPYLVIYDSNKKYAKPAAFVKLVNCTVKPCQSELSDDDACAFWIAQSRHIDDADVITLKASSTQQREEWVRLLAELTKGGISGNDVGNGYVPGSSVLPTLAEQEGDDDEVEVTNGVGADTLKAPQRRKMREGRRSSLNSLGIRLRSYSNSKQRDERRLIRVSVNLNPWVLT